ncbi:hypothetical protein E4U22_002284 [Claviceps purpurea]|nr:hypothetical protein E4U22_002284 [Claviceps purpurea]
MSASAKDKPRQLLSCSYTGLDGPAWRVLADALQDDALRQFEAQFTQVRSPGIGKNIFSRLKPRNRKDQFTQVRSPGIEKNIFSRLKPRNRKEHLLPPEAQESEFRKEHLLQTPARSEEARAAKRRRLNRTAEIPSTPKEMLGTPSSWVWTERDDQDLRWADGVRAEELLLRAKAVQGTKRKDLSPRWDPVVRAAEGKRRRAKRKFNWLT